MTDAHKRLVAILLAFVPVLAIGAGFGGDTNQSTYLNPGLKLAHPEMWVGDWWLENTIHYHVLFSWLVLALEKIGIMKPAIALGNILTVFGSFYLVYLIIRETVQDKALEIFAAVILMFVFLYETSSVAGTYLFNNGFQPSSLGAVGYLLAMYFFIRGKYLHSGISVGLFSLFHANFMVLAFPLFGLAHLLIRERGFVKRSLRQFTPMVICLFLLLPSILATVDYSTASEIKAEALNILFTIRAPWHYDFSYFVIEFLPFFGWLALGFSGLYLLKKHIPETGRIISLYVALVSIIVFSFIEALMVGSDLMARLFVWRLAPFALLLAMIFIWSGILSNTQTKAPVSRMRLVIYSLFIVGSLAVIVVEISQSFYSSTPRPLVFPYMVIVMIALLAGKFIFPQARGLILKLPFKSFNSALVIAIPVGLLFLQGPDPLDRCKFMYLDEGCKTEKEGLYKATSTLTENNSVFIVPPDVMGFRLATGRALVASWKDAPFRPVEVIEWHRRMVDITGAEKITSYGGAVVSYQSQRAVNLVNLRIKYRVDYAVFWKQKSFNPEILETFGPPVYENSKYYIFSLTPTENEGG